MTNRDEAFMGIAVAMARRGLGRVWPNPAVGAVVVSPGEEPEIIARGWTMPGGRPHAETVALDQAGERARGATLFVTLEPCAHHGRTPPCADAIIAAGIARVVCGIGDPDPRVAGRGFERLRAASMDVITGVLDEQVRRGARGHLCRVTQGRPYITLKLAVGADGMIAPGSGAPAWVTGEHARARGHLLRARADAILVGRGTVSADNPELTCRLPGMADRSPLRVILDTQARMPATARLLDSVAAVPVWIICSDTAAETRESGLSARGAELVHAPTGTDGRLDVAAVARVLGARGITRLLVEGGPTVARSFLDAGLIDEAVIFQGCRPAGKGALKPFGDKGLERLEAAGYRLVGSRKVGEDAMLRYERQ